MGARGAGTSARLNPVSFWCQQRKRNSRDHPKGRKTHTSSTAFPSHWFLRDKPPEKCSGTRKTTIWTDFWSLGVFSSSPHCEQGLSRVGHVSWGMVEMAASLLLCLGIGREWTCYLPQSSSTSHRAPSWGQSSSVHLVLPPSTRCTPLLHAHGQYLSGTSFYGPRAEH